MIFSRTANRVRSLVKRITGSGPGRRLARAIRSRPARIGWRIASSSALWGLIALGAIAYVVAPEVMVRRARTRAAECLAQARAPRGPALPDCSFIVRDFDHPSHVSYTRHDATYRAEELIARVAVNRYLDAAIGDPHPARLRQASLGVRNAQQMMDNGSQRISLEELGPAIGAPHLGKLASSIQDREALIDNAEFFGLWYVRYDVLEAAMIEADFEEVERLALRYADWNPGDADLRAQVGATLCLFERSEGHALLDNIPARRADKRYENLQRDYGEVFAVLHACADTLGFPAPRMPEDSGAGVADAAEVRRVTRLRLASAGLERAELVKSTIELLSSQGDDGLDVQVPYARAALVAAVIAQSEGTIAPAVLTRMVSPRGDAGEGPIGPRGLTLSSLLLQPIAMQPVVPAGWLRAAARVIESAGSASKDAAESAALKKAAGGMFALAARELALNGAVDDALACAEAGARLAELSPRASALSLGSVVYVAGDPARALDIVRRAPRQAATPAAGGAGPDSGQGSSADIELGIATLEALLVASNGDSAAAAELASALPEAARSAKDYDTALDARWLAAALAPRSTPAAPAQLTRLESTGQLNASLPLKQRAEIALAAKLAGWAEALQASSELRRAFRYALFEHRGDMPAFALPYLVAAQRLLDAGSTGDAAEIWLDALSGVDKERLRLRSYAWMRMEAARIRRDEPYARLWSERLAVLRELASEEAQLEVTRFLRF